QQAAEQHLDLDVVGIGLRHFTQQRDGLLLLALAVVGARDERLELLDLRVLGRQLFVDGAGFGELVRVHQVGCRRQLLFDDGVRIDDDDFLLHDDLERPQAIELADADRDAARLVAFLDEVERPVARAEPADAPLAIVLRGRRGGPAIAGRGQHGLDGHAGNRLPVLVDDVAADAAHAAPFLGRDRPGSQSERHEAQQYGRKSDSHNRTLYFRGAPGAGTGPEATEAHAGHHATPRAVRAGRVRPPARQGRDPWA